MSDQAMLADCVQAATLAPSLHNSQPWRCRIGDHIVGRSGSKQSPPSRPATPRRPLAEVLADA